MSFFEYNITADITPLLEEQTTKLLNIQNHGVPFFHVVSFSDEVVSEEKKRRSFVLTSPTNIWNFFFNHFKDSSAEMKVYQKQRII